MPGNNAPKNKSPTLIAIRSAITTNIMLGGIRMPRVPTAQTVPDARRLSYPFSSMTGSPSKPKSTTDAPIIPVDAASKTPIIVTVIARPPLTGPNKRANPVSSPRAIPERSNKIPIKINIGRATMTQFSITSQIRSTVMDV